MSCDDYCTNFGCNSGPGCPVGGACHHMPGCKDAACPGHPGLHARQVVAAHGVAPIKSSRPKWLDGKGTAVPSEAGNFQIIDLGPDDDGQPLTHDESMALVRTLLAWLVGVVVVVAAAAFASSYGTERFAEALWQFLGGLS